MSKIELEKNEPSIEIIVNVLNGIKYATSNDSKINMLVAARSLVDSKLMELTGAEPMQCKHPNDRRLNMKTMGDGYEEHWVCKDCQYEHIELIK
jgi:hypothetical protein